MFLGYNTNGFAHHRLEDAVDILAELGYRGRRADRSTSTTSTRSPTDWPDRARRLDGQLRKARTARASIETGRPVPVDPRRKHQPTLLDPDRHADRSTGSTSSSAASRLGAALEADCRQLLVRGTAGRLAAAHPHGPAGRGVPALARLRRRSRRPPRVRAGAGHVHRHDGQVRRAARQGEPPELRADARRRPPASARARLPVGDHIRAVAGRASGTSTSRTCGRGVHDHLMFGEGEVDFADVFAGPARDRLRRRGVRRAEPAQPRRGGDGPEGDRVPAAVRAEGRCRRSCRGGGPGQAWA